MAEIGVFFWGIMNDGYFGKFYSFGENTIERRMDVSEFRFVKGRNRFDIVEIEPFGWKICGSEGEERR